MMVNNIYKFDSIPLNLENERKTFIFHRCSKALERVSKQRNEKWRDNATDKVDVVPQNALINICLEYSISALVPK
jgi:hypothetical protein